MPLFLNPTMDEVHTWIIEQEVSPYKVMCVCVCVCV